MRWQTWIWAVGGAAWLLDAALEARHGHPANAKLAFALAAVFGLAFAFFAQTTKPKR
ncbi:hypothetical protein SAMN05421819_1509 [Bryocella elongata]|uniref:Uncharacterized protein n=1 Tax=Bryocella elongata TaxID=863522 RepID=A0A1H5WBM1_9BACT|nr:hypothetical protein [Bryocella elongata]SEF96855.1 hypothetical protein SAMN05421819_1509 [Bryocella elongata]